MDLFFCGQCCFCCWLPASKGLRRKSRRCTLAAAAIIVILWLLVIITCNWQRYCGGDEEQSRSFCSLWLLTTRLIAQEHPLIPFVQETEKWNHKWAPNQVFKAFLSFQREEEADCRPFLQLALVITLGDDHRHYYYYYREWSKKKKKEEEAAEVKTFGKCKKSFAEKRNEFWTARVQRKSSE